MAENIYTSISALLNYAEEHGLIEKCDRRYSANALIDILGLDEFCDVPDAPKANLCEILGELCDYAFEKGLIESNSVVYRDLFDTKLMGVLTPRPSEFINKFERILPSLLPTIFTTFPFPRTTFVAIELKRTSNG